jgi:hypothetical protein
MCRWLRCFCLLGLGPALTAESTAAVEPATILAQVKAASGGQAWDTIYSIHTRGDAAHGGLSRTVEEWDDVSAGRYVKRSESLLASGAEGFDGISAWTQTKGGESYVLGDEDARLGAINASYQVSFAYWFPDRRAGTMQSEGTRQENGHTFDVIVITPAAGRPFRVWIDRGTHLIDRFVEQEAEEIAVTRFSDYREVQGVLLPFAIRSGRQDEDEKDWDVETVKSAALNEPVEQKIYALPAFPPPDYQMLRNEKSTTISFQLTADNRILVPVKLNGQGPFLAEFDSGGGYIVQPAVAARLKIKALGSNHSYGGGEGSTLSGRAILDTVEIGGARLTRQRVNIFSFAQEEPERILIGSQILQRFAVEINFDQSLMTLTPLSQFSYTGHGVTVPFHFQDNQPEVYGSVDGIAGVFPIDTGDSGSLLLIAPFAARYHLYDFYQATIPYGGSAVGGGTYGLLARAKVLALFGADRREVLESENPLTRLSKQTGGFDANRYVSGNIGLGVLKQFNLAFDYRREEISFEKNSLFGQPDPYNRTGLHLKKQGTSWLVTACDPGSPAVDAGIKTGDTILLFDGKDATHWSHAAFHQLLCQPVGTRVTVKLQSGPTSRSRSLILKDIL